MKFILPIALAIVLISCGSTVSYNYPTVNQGVDVKTPIAVSQEEFSTIMVSTSIGPLKLGGGYDNVTLKLLDENEGYDFVVNPKLKSKSKTILPRITQKMEKVTAKLGKYSRF